jgi:hypothetical protein
MKKRGMISLNMIVWIPRIIFLAIVILAVSFMIMVNIKTEIYTTRTEAELFFYNLVYAPHGISYHDPLNNQLYPGIIDLTNIKDDKIITLENSFKIERKLAAEIKIENLDTGEKIDAKYDPFERFTKWMVLEGIGGPGGVEVVRKELYVLLREQSKINKGLLKITIVFPRT